MAITKSKERKHKIQADAPQYKSTGTTSEAVVAGAMVSQTGAGLIKNAATTDGYGVVGIALEDAASGAAVQYAAGVWEFSLSGVTAGDKTKTVYALDNDGITLSSNSCVVGTILDVDVAAGKVFVNLKYPFKA